MQGYLSEARFVDLMMCLMGNSLEMSRKVGGARESEHLQSTEEEP